MEAIWDFMALQEEEKNGPGALNFEFASMTFNFALQIREFAMIFF